jgi:hypothetical protein
MRTFHIHHTWCTEDKHTQTVCILFIPMYKSLQSVNYRKIVNFEKKQTVHFCVILGFPVFETVHFRKFQLPELENLKHKTF